MINLHSTCAAEFGLIVTLPRPGHRRVMHIEQSSCFWAWMNCQAGGFCSSFTSDCAVSGLTTWSIVWAQQHRDCKVVRPHFFTPCFLVEPVAWMRCLGILQHRGDTESYEWAHQSHVGDLPEPRNRGFKGNRAPQDFFPLGADLIWRLQRSPCRVTLFCSGATLLCPPSAIGSATSLSYKTFLP